MPQAASAATVEEKQGVGFVTASALRLRSSPSTRSTTLDIAPNGDMVWILGQSGAWYRVLYDGEIGYMYSSYLTVSTSYAGSLGIGTVTGSGVNLRAGAGTSYSSLGKATLGASVSLLGIENGWFYVNLNGTNGYIRSDYVDISPAATASSILADAKSLLGTPYLWGGSTTAGFDCSGFVQYVFAQNGVSLPRTCAQQYTIGTYVSSANLQAGDLVFFDTSGSGAAGHVGIYMGDGNFIHCSSSSGVIISAMSNSYWSARYLGARRVL